MNLTDHRIDEIFADIKKGSKTTKPEELDELNEDEFEKAMSYLSNKTGFMSLDALGISKELLIFGVMVLAVILCLTFVFIFLGI